MKTNLKIDDPPFAPSEDIFDYVVISILLEEFHENILKLQDFKTIVDSLYDDLQKNKPIDEDSISDYLANEMMHWSKNRYVNKGIYILVKTNNEVVTMVDGEMLTDPDVKMEALHLISEELY
jgi:hypothetical protein